MDRASWVMQGGVGPGGTGWSGMCRCRAGWGRAVGNGASGVSGQDNLGQGGAMLDSVGQGRAA